MIFHEYQYKKAYRREKIIQVEQISKLSKFRRDKPREKIIIQFPVKGKAI